MSNFNLCLSKWLIKKKTQFYLGGVSQQCSRNPDNTPTNTQPIVLVPENVVLRLLLEDIRLPDCAQRPSRHIWDTRTPVSMLSDAQEVDVIPKLTSGWVYARCVSFLVMIIFLDPEMER